MTFRVFNVLVLALIGLASTISISIGYYGDIYGVYRDVRDRSLVTYQNERLTKFLFSYRYIPENFNAILVGSSITANWDTSAIAGVRMYNASMSGANASEEELIVRNVVRRRCPRLAVVTMFPYMTETHGRKSGDMRESDYWAGLGSINLLKSYAAKLLAECGISKQIHNSFGINDFTTAVQNWDGAAGAGEVEEFKIDEIGMRDYATTIRELRDCGATIVGVVPPLASARWPQLRKAQDKYLARVRPLFEGREAIIDLNDGKLTGFTERVANFTDGAHLSHAAAKDIVGELDRRLHDLGLLPVAPAAQAR